MDDRVLDLNGTYVWQAHNVTVVCLCCLTWLPDSQSIACGTGDGRVVVVNATNGKWTQNIKVHTHAIENLAWSPDGSCFLFSGNDYTTTVELWDANHFTCIQKYSGHTARVAAVHWACDGETFASCGYEGTTRVWKKGTPEPCHVLQADLMPITSIAFSPDSQRLAASGHGKMIRIWDVRSGTLCHVMSVTDWDSTWMYGSVEVMWSRDNSTFFSSTSLGNLNVWNAESGNLISSIQASSKISQMTLSKEGRYLLASGTSKFFIDLKVAKFYMLVKRNGNAPENIGLWSPDGTKILLAHGLGIRILHHKPWSDRTHYVFPAALRKAILHLMCVKSRLDKSESALLPRLPMAVWLEIFACIIPHFMSRK